MRWAQDFNCGYKLLNCKGDGEGECECEDGYITLFISLFLLASQAQTSPNSLVSSIIMKLGGKCSRFAVVIAFQHVPNVPLPTFKPNNKVNLIVETLIMRRSWAWEKFKSCWCELRFI